MYLFYADIKQILAYSKRIYTSVWTLRIQFYDSASGTIHQVKVQFESNRTREHFERARKVNIPASDANGNAQKIIQLCCRNNISFPSAAFDKNCVLFGILYRYC